MVTADIDQLLRECNDWRETLRSYREEFSQLKQQLQKNAAGQSLKEDLLQLEHLDNQLHIQLINIHDLKQSIKNHDKQLQLEIRTVKGHISDESIATHESILSDFIALQTRLEDVKEECQQFEERTA